MSDIPSPAPAKVGTVYGRFLPLLFLALLGAVILLTATRYGVGLSPDSIVYVAAARNLYQGDGLTLPFGNEINGPLDHHAPLYPAILAVGGWLGSDPLLAARALQALLFAANILLAAWLIRQLLPGQVLWSFVGAFFFLISPPLFTLHTMAWTEALFLFLSFAGLSCLALHLQRQDWSWLWRTAFFLALALLTRYAGVAVVGTAVIALFLLSNRPWRTRLTQTILLTGLSLLPFLVWTSGSSASGGTIRTLSFHPVGLTQLQQGLNTVAGWFLIPASLPAWAKAGLLLLVACAFMTALWLHRRRQPNPLPLSQGWPPLLPLLLLFAVFYPAFLLLSISFFDANTPLDDRILSPLAVTLIILLTYAVGLSWPATRRSWIMLAPLLLLALFISIGQIGRSADWWRSSYQQGIGFNSLTWQQSDLLQSVRQLEADTVLYANAPEPVNLHTGRPVLRLPRKFESVTQSPNDQYEAEMAALKERLHREGGVVVYFSALQLPTLPTPAEMTQDLALVPLVKTEDGLLYGPDK